MSHALSTHLLSHITPPSLLLLLNFPRSHASQILHPLLSSLEHTLPPRQRHLLLPRYLTADYQAKDRESVYTAGGLVLATASILVHDFLHGTLNAKNVTGVLVFAADSVSEGSNEHFALKLFRAGNRNGFVTAFSEHPVSVSRGFHGVEKLMRTLYVSHLSLWPRFRREVKDVLRKHQPDLVDLDVQMSVRMGALVTALRECVWAVLEDVRGSTREIDLSELKLESNGKGLVWHFDRVVRRQLEAGDVRITSRVRGFLADLEALRGLMTDVFELNAVAFYQRVVTLRHAAGFGNNWLVRKEAQRAVLLARSRVWIIRKVGGSVEEGDGVGESREVELGGEEPVKTVATLEISPKWKALMDVINEIQEDVKAAGDKADVGRILVAVKEQRTVDELRAVLRDGADKYLRTQFDLTFPSVSQRARESEEQDTGVDGLRQMTMTQLLPPDDRREPSREVRPRNLRRPEQRGRERKRPRVAFGSGKEEGAGWQGQRSVEEFQAVFREVKSKRSSKIEILIWCMEWVDMQGRGHRILEEYHPAFVVLYNTDLAVVRQVEVFKASHPGRPLRMYILSYSDAAEEERFRNASEREKSAFKTLIRERATMSVHVDQEGRQPEEEFTQSLLQQEAEITSFSAGRGLGVDRDSRKTGKIVQRVRAKGDGGKVLVDTRELRSKLPMLLYQSSLSIVPLTLEVGDFILSKNIGIERKSVPDLYGSFGSGRLFNQAEALCRHYKYPCLLIELDASKSLSLTATAGGVPSEISATFIVSKMVLLMLQFPGLRLLWVKGAQDAAKLFPALKANEEEPDEAVAAELGVDTKESEETSFNAGPKMLLRSLPGIDSQNLNRVMRKVRNVATLLTMSMQEMTEVLGSAGKASTLYNFVNEQPSEALAAL